MSSTAKCNLILPASLEAKTQYIACSPNNQHCKLPVQFHTFTIEVGIIIIYFFRIKLPLSLVALGSLCSSAGPYAFSNSGPNVIPILLISLWLTF